MIKLFIGAKGSGKTKTLIEMVNTATKESNGAVVCIEKGDKLRYDIKYQARLINTKEYMINDAQSLYGFVAGILASNHDVTDLFIDGTLKICRGDIPAFENLVVELEKLVNKIDINLTMTVSMDESAASETIRKFI